MSVGDIKGYRRRFKILKQLGHAPTPKGRSVGEAVEAARRAAARQAKIKQAPKRG